MYNWKIIAACVLLLNGGCAVSRFGNTYEGANDYRIVPTATFEKPSDCKTAQKTLPVDSKAIISGTDASILLPEVRRKAVWLACYSRFQNHPSVSEGIKNDRYFANSDNLAIFLRNMKLAFFTEGYPEIWSNELFSSPVKGEIAIVANITQGARTPGGRNEQGKLEGNVVFYSGDILKGQQANEFNIPIYGPHKYNGGALTIELWALELDEFESKQFGPILKTLAGLSTQLVGITGGAGDVLSKLGSAFLNGNSDDVISHIAITLVPPNPGSTTTDPVLQVSDIIVHRNRNGEARWRGIALDDCYYESRQSTVLCGNELKEPDRNAFILALRKSSMSDSLVSDFSIDTLNERLAKTSSLTEVNQVLQENAADISGRMSNQKALDAVTRMADTGTSQAVREDDAKKTIALLQCALLSQAYRDAASGAIEAKKKSFDDYCPGPGRALSIDEFDTITRKMIEFLNFDSDKLATVGLIGPSAAPSVSDLKGLRDALLQYATPRTAQPSPEEPAA